MQLVSMSLRMALAVALGAGCTLLYDAGDFEVGLRDADTPRPPEPDAAPDPCDHALPPPRPDASDTSGASITFALSHLALVSGDGARVGFDLDGVCTCDDRPGTVRGGASSCAPRRADEPLCDQRGGRDNGAAVVFAKLVPDRADAGVDVGYDVAAREGAGGVLVELGEYSGAENDPSVFVGIYDSPGLDPPRDCDAGVRGDAGVNGEGKPRPAWGGCDEWRVAEGSVLGSRPRTFTREAWVANGTLVARFTTLSIRIGSSEVLLYDAIVTAAIKRPAPPALPRLEQGVLAGRVVGSDLLRVFGEQIVLGRPLCLDPVSSAVFRATACGMLDLGSSPDASAPCDSVSFTVEFSGGLAQRGIVAPGAPAKTPCASAPPPSCP